MITIDHATGAVSWDARTIRPGMPLNEFEPPNADNRQALVNQLVASFMPGNPAPKDYPLPKLDLDGQSVTGMVTFQNKLAVRIHIHFEGEDSIRHAETLAGSSGDTKFEWGSISAAGGEVDVHYPLPEGDRITPGFGLSLDLDQFQTALNALIDAKGIDPQAAEALSRKYQDMFYRSRALRRGNQHDYDGAISDYDELLALNPGAPDLYGFRAETFLKKGDYQAAIRDFSEVLTHTPEDTSALRKRGIAYWLNGDLDQALSDYSEAIRVKPSDHTLYKLRGAARRLMEDHEGAVADYTQVLRSDPRDAIACCERAISRANLGDFAGAQADLNEAIKLKPKESRTMEAVAWVRLLKKDYGGVVRYAGEAIKLNAEYGAAYYCRALAHDALKEPVAAREDYQMAQQKWQELSHPAYRRYAAEIEDYLSHSG